MKQLEPQGLGQRVVSALALLLGLSFGAHLVWEWLRPLVPIAVSGLVLAALFQFIFRRRK